MRNNKKTRADNVDWRHLELLRPDEVAKLIGESRSGIYARIKRGQIPSIKFGKSVRVPRIELERLLFGLNKPKQCLTD